MILKIWDAETAKTCDDDQLFLRLMQSKIDDHIDLFVTNKDGISIKSGCVCIIHNKLKVLILCDGLNEKIPLKTDIDNVLISIRQPEYEEKAYRERLNFYAKSITQEIISKEDVH